MSISLTMRHLTGSPIITGMMWLSLAMCGMPARSSAARTLATCRRWRSRSMLDAFKCWIEAVAAAAIAGGSAVVKMKPEAKERMKSHSASEPVM